VDERPLAAPRAGERPARRFFERGPDVELWQVLGRQDEVFDARDRRAGARPCEEPHDPAHARAADQDRVGRGEAVADVHEGVDAVQSGHICAAPV
jgi:hypothetical protein